MTKPMKKRKYIRRSAATPTAPSSLLSFISCRGPDYDTESFGPHRLDGDNTTLFHGGPIDRNLILVHGYNAPHPQMAPIYDNFAKLLKRSALCYCWPGGDHPLDFLAAVGRAALSGYRLRDTLAMRAHAGVQQDTILAHSLGARVSLTALLGCATQVDKLILMAPAVDWDVFQPGREFANVSMRTDGEIHILYSKHDAVLKVAFPLGDATGNHHALGLAGPKVPSDLPNNIFLHNMSDSVHDHGDYLWRPECISVLTGLLDKTTLDLAGPA